MKQSITILLTAAFMSATLAACQSPPPSDTNARPANLNRSNAMMELGNFSISLSVKDIAASRAFYEKLGFTQVGGDQAQHWLIMQNGQATIGLFQGLFEGNILTFNPGWDREGNNVDPFTDVREIQKRLKQLGIELTTEADPDSSGPAHITLIDPDGNAILIDQHR